MSKTLTLLTVSLLTLSGLHAQAAEGKQGHHRGEVRQQILATFDADKDGKLNDAERAAAKAACKARLEAIKKEFDADNDGKLNEAERDAARAASSAMLKEKHPDRFAAIDTDHDGVISRVEGKAARGQRRENRQERREHSTGAGK